MAYLAGAEEDAQEQLGRRLTLEELRASVARYPGDPEEVAERYERQRRGAPASLGCVKRCRVYDAAMDDDPADARDIPDEGDTRTPAWYWSRLELGVGVVFVLLIAFTGWSNTSPCFGCDAISLGPLLVSERVIGAIVALPLAIVGLIWMVRILRGPRDEPPPWRYRKR